MRSFLYRGYDWFNLRLQKMLVVATASAEMTSLFSISDIGLGKEGSGSLIAPCSPVAIDPCPLRTATPLLLAEV